MTGRIVKGVAGVYDVSVEGAGIFSCPARGLFKKLGQTPIAGDLVIIDKIDVDKRTAYLHEILPRTNELVRPRAANVSQGILVFSLVSPEASMLMVDAMLCYMHSLEIKPIICVNKVDLVDRARVMGIIDIYEPAGYAVRPVSAADGVGTEALRAELSGHVTILAGPSGVGKSSLVNAMFPQFARETGALSVKIQRGKNTTRSCELLEIGGGGFLADSPGFTAFDPGLLPKEGLDLLFPEFEPFLGECYYTDCRHLSEHDCAVKEQIGQAVHTARYENYAKLANAN